MVVTMMDRLTPFLFLLPVGYTIYYLAPRFYNFSKYKLLQMIFLYGFLILGIFCIPLIFAKYTSETSMPVLAFFITYDAFILFLSFYLFQNKIDSTTIFFMEKEEIKKLVSDSLTRLEWRNIQIQEREGDLIEFSDPNQPFTVQASFKEDRFIVLPKILDDATGIDLRILKKFSINMKYDLASYPPNTEMIKLFRRKNLKFLILLWGVFFVFQMARMLL
jgi:hypothetical protein